MGTKTKKVRSTIQDKLKGKVKLKSGVELISFPSMPDEEKEMVRKWRNHPNIRKWMYNSKPISREEHLSFIEKLKQSGEDFYFLVKEGGKYIGVISIRRVDFYHKHCFLGIYANPYSKTKGLGKKLIQALDELVFDFMKFHSLKLEVIEGNEKAINLYRKAGFEEEGKLKEYIRKGKKWKDIIIMGKVSKKNEN